MERTIARIFVAGDRQLDATRQLADRRGNGAFLVQTKPAPKGPPLLLERCFHNSVFAVHKFVKGRVYHVDSLVVRRSDHILELDAGWGPVLLWDASWPRRIEKPPWAVRANIRVQFYPPVVSSVRVWPSIFLFFWKLSLKISPMRLFQMSRVLYYKAINDDVWLNLHILLKLLIATLVEVYQVFIHSLSFYWPKSTGALSLGSLRSLFSTREPTVVSPTPYILRDLIVVWQSTDWVLIDSWPVVNCDPRDELIVFAIFATKSLISLRISLTLVKNCNRCIHNYRISCILYKKHVLNIKKHQIILRALNNILSQHPINAITRGDRLSTWCNFGPYLLKIGDLVLRLHHVGLYPLKLRTLDSILMIFISLCLYQVNLKRLVDELKDLNSLLTNLWFQRVRKSLNLLILGYMPSLVYDFSVLSPWNGI